MNKGTNVGPAKRPYQKPELRRLSPEEAQARLREHALRSRAAALPSSPRTAEVSRP